MLPSTSGRARRFSWAYSPGATKAQAWYSTTGRQITKATIKVTLIGTKNGVTTPVAIIRVPAGKVCSIGCARRS